MSLHLDCSKTTQCHSSHKIKAEKTKFEKFIVIAEKVSLVALGAFSAYVSWKLFLPFFVVGLFLGIWNHLQEKTHHKHAHDASSCANGFLEQLAGVKLPPLVSLAANLAVTACHIDHHATVFVPIVGISVGSWIGKSIGQLASYSFKKINSTQTLAPNIKTA